ncbi:MAG: SpoVR family protein [Deltaproteobacteria bacterium]|nr:SpoVR family protein [Deltaproteobacteria bacterium]
MDDSTLTPELEGWRQRIEGYARHYGLDFFGVVFELLDWNEINVVASYGGFPSRYPHWRFGMEYEHMSKSYRYGLSRIYEMVINNNPCYAYLLKSNGMIDQKMVMAHVFAHADFFKNNVYFAGTNPKMIDVMGNHRTKVHRYIDRFGLDRVEGFIDRCLSLENLIDIHRPAERQKNARPPKMLDENSLERMKGKPLPSVSERIPLQPERDVLLFIRNHASLEEWERDLVTMIRDEQLYFAPQAQTKILNEGWAAYWHSKIMTEKVLDDSEIIDYAQHHSATVSPQPGKLNPYKLGMELLRDVERRFGHEKIFKVRALHNDLTFIDEFLTEEFCEAQNFFVYGFNQANGTYEITDRDFKKVREKLLVSLTNMGAPIVQVTDGNYGGRGELGLKHLHEGVDLRLDWAKETLLSLQALWKRPVHIETIVEGIPKSFSFDGEEHHEQRMT